MGGIGKCKFDGFRLGSGRGSGKRGRRYNGHGEPGSRAFMLNYMKGLVYTYTRTQDQRDRHWCEYKFNCMEEQGVYVITRRDWIFDDVVFEYVPWAANESHIWRYDLRINHLKLSFESEMGASPGAVASAAPGSAAPVPPVPEALPKVDPGPPQPKKRPLVSPPRAPRRVQVPQQSQKMPVVVPPRPKSRT